LFDGEHLPDGADPAVDPPVVIGPVRFRQPSVQLRQRLHLRHRDQVVAPESPAFAFDATLLVGPFDTWQAVEPVELGRPWVHEF
jgi:hypothetical protein